MKQDSNVKHFEMLRNRTNNLCD